MDRSCPSSSSCVEAGGRPVRWRLEMEPLAGAKGQVRTWGWGPRAGGSVLMRRDPRKLTLSPPREEDTVRSWLSAATKTVSPEAEAAGTCILDLSAPRTEINKLPLFKSLVCGIFLWQPKLTKTLTPEGSAILPVHPSSVIPRTRAFSPKCCLLTTSSRPPELPWDHTLFHRWPPQETLSQRILLRGQRSGRRGNGTRNC